MAPKDESELQQMLVTCINHNGPSALRIPRGSGEGSALMEEGWESLEIGKAEIIEEGEHLLIIGYGSMVCPAIKTAAILKESGVKTTVINARFIRPLDEETIHKFAKKIGKVVTMEEGTLLGGFGSAVVESFNDNDIFVPTLRIGIPDKLVDHATPQQSKESLGLTPELMAGQIRNKFNFN